MKKIALMALTAMAFFSCSQDETPTTPDSNEEPVVILKINVRGAVSSRSIEDEHAGGNGDSVYPKIFNGAVIPYNEHGVALSAITIDKDQIKGALIGKFFDSEGNLQTGNADSAGLKIGLPRGTKRVDIVLNRFTAAEQGITNINYFNMQEYRDINGKPITNNGTNSNFERVPLVTQYQGVGMELIDKSTSVTKAAAKPEYKVEFEVSPNLARFEVFGAIDVAKPAEWTDKYGNHWYEITQDEFKLLTFTPEVTFDENGVGSDFGLMLANEKNGFFHKKGAVYIPKYYWHTRKGTTGKERELIEVGKNVYTRQEIDDEAGANVGWVEQGDPFTAHLIESKFVKWNPNVFYAIDVEEIFINNIKIRGATYEASMHNWPGSESPKWQHWYNAFHLHGWHSNGVSADNTFLCRGNMWDRITDDSKVTETVDIPSITIGNESFSTMKILTGKAVALPSKSGYADVNANPDLSRNLGVISKKAAAYQIYSQSSTLDDNEANKNALANALPHVILKVKAYRTATDYAAGTKVAQKEFITIKLFKNGIDRIRSFKAGSIYRLNMNDLLGSFVGEIPVPNGVSDKAPTDPVEPDPEMPGADLTVTVTVVPWTIINMKPEI